VRRGISVDGVLALRILDREAGRTIGYDLIAIRSGYRIPLAREHSPGQKAGRFFLREDALREAERILRNAAVTQSVVILDEVGRLEMTGGGHALALEAVLAGSALPVLTIRRSLVGQMRDRLGASTVDCVDVARGEILNGREGGS
jgi:nucleoside-triphosphatase THEP1